MPTPLQLSQANRVYGYFQIDQNGNALYPNGAVGLSNLSLNSVAQLDIEGYSNTPRLLFNAERTDGSEIYNAYIQAYIEETSEAGYIAIGTSDGATGQAELIFNGADIYAAANSFDINSDIHIYGTLRVGDIPTGTTETMVLVVDAFGNVKLRTDFAVSTYTNVTPVPVTIGGIAAGTTFSNQTMQQMWDALLYPYQSPAFSTFSISGQATIVEVGEIISGTKTFIWSATNSSNIQTNSISITDVTNSTILAAGLANDGTEAIALPTPITKSNLGNHTWNIAATNTNAGSFSKNYTVSWYWKIYYGTNANSTLTEADVESLSNAVLDNDFIGTFSFVGGDYKYFCYPNSYGSISTIKDEATNLNIAMASSVDDAFFSNSANGIYYGLVTVTNTNGVSTTYRVYRSKNILGGSITFVIS